LFKKDPANYAYTIRDKISENALGMKQIANNSTELAMLGGFTKAAGFAKVAFHLLKGRM
jgi:type I restriction enzyme R subunit